MAFVSSAKLSQWWKALEMRNDLGSISRGKVTVYDLCPNLSGEEKWEFTVNLENLAAKDVGNLLILGVVSLIRGAVTFEKKEAKTHASAIEKAAAFIARRREKGWEASRVGRDSFTKVEKLAREIIVETAENKYGSAAKLPVDLRSKTTKGASSFHKYLTEMWNTPEAKAYAMGLAERRMAVTDEAPNVF